MSVPQLLGVPVTSAQAQPHPSLVAVLSPQALPQEPPSAVCGSELILL